MTETQEKGEFAELDQYETMLDSEESNEETYEEWSPKISNESPKTKLEKYGVKEKADGRILTIKSYSFTKPKTKNMDGTPIEPKLTQTSSVPFYSGKLVIHFEEDNLVEYYPNFHYFVKDNGSINNMAKINREGDNAVSKIYKLVIAKMDKRGKEDEISDAEVFDFLIGKKVKISTVSGTYLGKKWFRNDITSIEG